MSISTLLNQLKDPYEQKARVFPGLLVVLPLLVPLLWIFGPKNPILTTLLGLIVSCGAVYALASIARGMGKRLEEKLVARWGGMPTTLSVSTVRDSEVTTCPRSSAIFTTANPTPAEAPITASFIFPHLSKYRLLSKSPAYRSGP